MLSGIRTVYHLQMFVTESLCFALCVECIRNMGHDKLSSKIRVVLTYECYVCSFELKDIF